MKETEPMDSPKPLRQLCADLSLRCPGFAILRFEDGTVSAEYIGHLDSHGSKDPHGKILCDIHCLLMKLSRGIDVFVRERAFSRFHLETQTLNKVVGIADQAAWKTARSSYSELSPTTVKKLLTGSGKASKTEVAMALERYVGTQQYETDDESDAVAVGLAWLIQQNQL